ncbi:hypothetical protein HOF65_08685 [bacterium]|nr:hypothetical protein [bacterium]
MDVFIQLYSKSSILIFVHTGNFRWVLNLYVYHIQFSKKIWSSLYEILSNFFTILLVFKIIFTEDSLSEISSLFTCSLDNFIKSFIRFI